MISKLLAAGIKNQVQNINGEETLEGDINSIISGVMVAVGVVAVIFIIVGGVNYMTSQGDPGKIQKGKKTLISGIVGLIIVILAYAIVNFVLNSL
ncbi:MAG: pilin [Candidatus Saccharibacteria bacterium]|nr:pilin [Candidatus Saccharibacteria bacterium]